MPDGQAPHPQPAQAPKPAQAPAAPQPATPAQAPIATQGDWLPRMKILEESHARMQATLEKYGIRQ